MRNPQLIDQVELKPGRVVIGGVPVDRYTRAEWVRTLLEDWRAKSGPKVVTTANGQVLSLFAVDSAYREAVLSADHVAPDGMSIVRAAKRWTRRPLAERVATTDWFHDAAEAAVEHGMKFYLLGAQQEVIERAAERAVQLHPGLQIVGVRNGYFTDAELPAIAEEIRASGADVLWLGVGNPRQVIVGHKLKALSPQLTWIRTCGGLFDFLAGDKPRAPMLLQKMGFEWLWRAVLEPRRLLWRYVTTNIHSLYLMATRSGDPAILTPRPSN